MNKRDIFLQIQKVYVAHVTWKNAVQKLHLGIIVDKKQIDLLYTDCAFGKWYYGEGQYLSGLKSFKDIEPIHRKIHKILQVIYKMSLKEEYQEGEKVLKFSIEALSNSDKNLVGAYCKDFINANKEFSEAVKKLYQEINEIPEKSFGEFSLLFRT